MVLAVTMHVKGIDIGATMSKLANTLPEETGDELLSYSKSLAGKLRDELLSYPRKMTADRQRAAMRIKGRKFKANEYGVVMPKSLIMLDAMQPHFVSLKGNPSMASWAKRNYGSTTVSNKSTLSPKFKTQRGRTTKGAIHVTPIHFVQPVLNKERNKLPNVLRKGIKKAYAKARTSTRS